jgi:glycosyltransferase involved in cell wall biosynthesis
MRAGSVLYVIQHHDVSGAERMHAQLIREDEDALVACPPGSRTEAFARELGALTTPLPFRALRRSAGSLETARSVFRGLDGARELRRILRAHPERAIVFCISIRPAMLASLAAVGLDRRVLWCVPEFLPPMPLRGPIRALARWRAAGALCLSGAVAREFAGRSRKLGELTRVVYPGVDVDRFDPRQGSPGASTAAVLGHVSVVKRTDMAVEIAAGVARQVPGFRLRIIGRAQYRDEDFELERSLRQRVSADRELGEVVEFRGFEADVPAALAGSGMLLHCCPDEPFGIALIEAMALGMPVVAPASAGPLEIVTDGETGFLYPPSDVEAATACVARLCLDPERARRMGVAARLRVESRFSLPRQLTETRAMIAELAG